MRTYLLSRQPHWSFYDHEKFNLCWDTLNHYFPGIGYNIKVEVDMEPFEGSIMFEVIDHPWSTLQRHGTHIMLTADAVYQLKQDFPTAERIYVKVT